MMEFHKPAPLLTVASPDLGQVAAALAGLLAELDHVAARCFRGDGHLGRGLFAIAEVHRQYHLKEEDDEKHEDTLICLN